MKMKLAPACLVMALSATLAMGFSAAPEYSRSIVPKIPKPSEALDLGKNNPFVLVIG